MHHLLLGLDIFNQKLVISRSCDMLLLSLIPDRIISIDDLHIMVCHTTSLILWDRLCVLKINSGLLWTIGPHLDREIPFVHVLFKLERLLANLFLLAKILLCLEPRLLTLFHFVGLTQTCTNNANHENCGE